MQHTRLNTPSQTGSTSLGVIVGIVLGLVVALAVSLYLAYSGAPIQQKPAKDATVTTPNPANAKAADPKDLKDPNESLYGKAQKAEILAEKEAKKDTIDGKEVSKDQQNKEQQKDTVKDAAKEAQTTKDNTTKPGVNSTKTNPVDTDPIGTIAKANSKPAEKPAEKPLAEPIAMPKSAKPLEGGERYFVQVGAYANVNEAEAVRAKIALLGVSMALSPRDKDGQILQRVRTSPLAAADAEKLRNNLRSNGIESSLVKVQ